MTTLYFLANLFAFALGIVMLIVAVLFVIDINQTKDAVRRNYPVVGRFRYLFNTLGEFFRQYFFAMDREEMPFNRAQREWIYKSSKGHDNTVAFGSTKALNATGSFIFANAAFPSLDTHSAELSILTIGPGAKIPYQPNSIFNISGMSYGALSRPAIRALSKGANLANCWYNTGEGGLSEMHLEGGCDLVFQIGTAKYGVRDKDGNLSDDKLREIAAYENVRMFELKLAQGAKPGKGGMLPGVKVSEEIAKIRGIPVGEDSISPNRHPEIDSVQTLLDMLSHIREVTGKPVGFKTVLGSKKWLEELCEEIHKRGIESAPDFITIDSGDGGTGAAPMPLMDNVGTLLFEALPTIVDILNEYGLRERVRVVSSGKLVTPADAAWAICAGADFVVSARGFLFALGCIQSLKCNKNTCPTGITTHNKRLQKGLDPTEKSVRVKHFVERMRYGLGLIAHSCGVAGPRGLGRHHVRIMQNNGLSVHLDEFFPEISVRVEYRGKPR